MPSARENLETTAGENPPVMADERDRAQRAHRVQLEANIGKLTRDLGRVLRQARVEDRDELQEYAINLLRSEMTRPSVGIEAPPSARRGLGTFGLALLLLLTGGVLLVLVPPVGVVLLLSAMVAGAWGIAAYWWRALHSTTEESRHHAHG